MAISFFRHAFNRVAAARKHQADLFINDTLMKFDDRTLKNFGTSREELLRERSKF